MALKTRYRKQYRDGGRVDPPGQADLLIERPAEAVSAPAPAPLVDNPEPQPEPQPQKPQHDDATLALQKQIEGLRQSEQLQRQQAAQAAMTQQPMTREARLAAWQAQGLSPAELQFFQRNPAMVDFPQITSFAIHRANEAGLERGTEAHFATVEKIFNANLDHLQAQANPAMQPTTPTPKFFAAPPGPPARSMPNPSARVSAPVSRSIPNASGKRHHSPGKVTLTPGEVEAARISGLSLEEYAKNKIEYQRQREAGEYRDNRER